MKISVVITALNHAGTIIECIESVLSQTRLPDEIGLALGPSRDGTDRMAEFYREEFDFIHYERKVDTEHHGLAHLRLDSLEYLETDFVIFLAADSYLRPGCLETIDEVLEGSYLVLGGVDFLTHDHETWSVPPPSEWSVCSLLETGILHPGAIVWSREALLDHFTRFQVASLGPFSTLGWLLVLKEAGISATLCSDVFVETWSHRMGESCWTLSVFEALENLRSLMEKISVDESLVQKFDTTLELVVGRQDAPVSVGASEQGSQEVFTWGNDPKPFPE